jgi:diguanylate cyclase (GGDEF)-like protein
MGNYWEQWRVYYSIGFLAASTIILLAAFLAMHRMVVKLPKGKVRRNWSVLRMLIGILIAAYISYAAVSWNSRVMDAQSIGYYVVPLIYFLSACIVYLVSSFVLDSAVYIKQFATGELENITDPLMGIHNRRYLDFRLQQEVNRALRYKLPMSILLLSLDNLKFIADTHGQQVCDGVLNRFGRLLQSSARTTDIVARYGEAEIMVVATNTPVSGISVFANRLRKAITDTLQLPKEEVTDFTKEKKDAAVTSSMGIAGLGGETATMETLVKSAEDALSQAKAKGRNMVIVNQSDSLLG